MKDIQAEIKRLEAEYENFIFMAEGCIYDHQKEMKHALLRKADNILQQIDELKTFQNIPVDEIERIKRWDDGGCSMGQDDSKIY